MDTLSIFPNNMNKASELSLERIITRLTYFHEQLHFLHWNTTSYAEHQALGSLYDYIHNFKDDIVEKIMGYSGKRPSIYSLEPLTTITSLAVVTDLLNFTTILKMYGEKNSYHDVCNLADSLSGEAAKTKYLLTLT